MSCQSAAWVLMTSILDMLLCAMCLSLPHALAYPQSSFTSTFTIHQHLSTSMDSQLFKMEEASAWQCLPQRLAVCDQSRTCWFFTYRPVQMQQGWDIYDPSPGDQCSYVCCPVVGVLDALVSDCLSFSWAGLCRPSSLLFAPH